MSIVGPVFWYDLTRIARRQRLALWRMLYASTLLLALYLLYATWFPRAGLFAGGWLAGSQLAEMSAFANYAFAAFAGLQFAAIILITPALTAGALAEERSHNTLGFLLTTQLTSREIVLGKLFTRLVQVGFLVLTGLPVLGLLQLFGGVDQLLVLAAFVGAGVTALSLGALGMVCALYVKKPQSAAWRAYQLIALYAILSTFMIWLFDMPAAKQFLMRRPMTPVFAPTGVFMMVPGPTVLPPRSPNQAVLESFNVGNPFFAAQRITYELACDVDIVDAVPHVLLDYVFVHCAFAALCLSIVIIQLREVTARQTAGLPFKRSIYLKPKRHPPIADRPVLWKEIHCETTPRKRWASWFFTRWLFFVGFVPMWVVIVFGVDNYDRMSSGVFAAISVCGTLVACGLLMRVGMQAARAIGAERDRQTLDCLLTTELRPSEIIGDKWLGSFLSGRWVFLFLLVHWLMGNVAMSIEYLSTPMLILEILVYGSFMVSLGLYLSVVHKTTKQAVISVLLVGLIGTTVVPWMCGKYLTVITDSHLSRGYPPDYAPRALTWPELATLSLSPGQVLYESAAHYDHFSRQRNHFRDEVVPSALVGMAVYSLFALILRRRALQRFQLIYARPRPRASVQNADSRP